MVDETRYITAHEIVLMLHWHADATGDETLRVTRSAIRKWTQRGHIAYDRQRRAYLLQDIVNYLGKRAMLRVS